MTDKKRRLDALEDNSITPRTSTGSTKKASRPDAAAICDNDFSRAQVNAYNYMEKEVEDKLTPEEIVANMSTMMEVRRHLEEGRDRHRPYVGDVFVAGSNDVNQLGLAKEAGIESNKFVANAMKLVEVVHVYARAIQCMILDRQGRVRSWGSSDKGVLGRPTDTIKDPEVERKALQVTGFKPSKKAVVRVDTENEDSAILQLALGGNHFLALGLSGAVYTSGCYRDAENVMWREDPPPDHPDNDNTESEQYAGAAPSGYRESPRHIWFMPQAVYSIECGNSMSAAILVDRTLVTWGIDCIGELGQGNKADVRELPQKFKTTHDPEEKKRIAEQVRTIFLKPKPVVYDPPIQGKHEVLDVACGDCHMLVVVRKWGNGVHTMVYSCGNNNYGQLGHGDIQARNVLTLITDLEGKNIVKVAAGNFHSIFLDASGRSIFSCGRSDDGQLGTTYDDKQEYCSRVARLGFDKNEDPIDLMFSSIAAGDNQSMAVSRTGKLFTWGYGDMGALGQGAGVDAEFRPTPVTKTISDHFVLEASGGSQHTIILATKQFDE